MDTDTFYTVLEQITYIIHSPGSSSKYTTRLSVYDEYIIMVIVIIFSLLNDIQKRKDRDIKAVCITFYVLGFY